MNYERLSQNIVTTLSENLRTYYSSLAMDKEDKLEPLLEEHSGDLKDKEDSKQTRYRLSYSKTPSDSEYSLYSVDLIKKPVSEKFEEKKGVVFLLKDENTGLVYIFTNNNKKFMNRNIISFLKIRFPDIFKVNFSSSDLRAGLETLEDYIGNQLYSKRNSSKRLFGKEPQTRVKFNQGDEPPHFSEIFDESHKNNLWVDWIRVETKGAKNMHKLAVSRSGDFRFIHGNILAHIRFLRKMGERALERYEMLSDREIKPDRGPSPIVLNYSFSALESKKNREKLISEFNEFKRCSYSVVHDGNPHIYMYISDKEDNSSYSIRSIGDSQIAITPQTEASSGSLMRLIDFLSSNFMDPNSIEELQ